MTNIHSLRVHRCRPHHLSSGPPELWDPLSSSGWAGLCCPCPLQDYRRKANHDIRPGRREHDLGAKGTVHPKMCVSQYLVSGNSGKGELGIVLNETFLELHTKKGLNRFFQLKYKEPIEKNVTRPLTFHFHYRL